MNNWQNKVSPERKQLFIDNIANQTRLSVLAIEKDWWVTMVLDALFKTSCADYLVFKGGTSLSKSWNLIERFSEDIDVAISRDFFGITNISSKNQMEKLRKASSKYIQDELVIELNQKMQEAGIEDFTIELEPTEASDKDPRVLIVKYSSLYPENPYLPIMLK